MIPAPYPTRQFAPSGSLESELPLVHRLPQGFSLAMAFDRLQSIPGVLWLDSVTHPTATLGRYSFLTADPLRRVTGTSLRPLAELVRQLPRRERSELPPFQGGIAGLFGYELARSLEMIPETTYNDLPTPPLSVGLYDWTIAVDHLTGESWIISQGFSPHEVGSDAGASAAEGSHAAAAARIDQVLQWLAAPPWPSPVRPPSVGMADVCPQFATPRHGALTSNFSSADFRAAVDEIVRSIRRGDAFQVNLAQRLLFPASQPAAEVYRRLRRENPAPEAGYYDGGSFQVLSSSPETFLRLRGDQVQTRPIKGTCRRSGDPMIDAEWAAELLASEKDRAENVMIVDLMRNDLSRVCTDASVQVDQLCQVEPYAFVQHLVSVVSGQLRSGAGIVDLLAACFPGGSVTGAPKVEAMIKIAELERVPRGPYCGSLGYISCSGAADFNILIRTMTQAHGHLQIPVGGGITAASDAVAEERETWHKAEGLLRALPI